MTKAKKSPTKSARPASKSAAKSAAKSVGGLAGSGARPSGSRSGDGKLHLRPGSFRKPKTDSRPEPASRRKATEQHSAEGEVTPGSTLSSSVSTHSVSRSPVTKSSVTKSPTSRNSVSRSSVSRSSGSTARKPNPPRLRGPELDTPPSGASFKDRDGKMHSFPDSALKRIAAQILTARNKKWRYRAFGFPIFSASGSEQELHFDFYVYDNMDSIFKLVLLMPRESREIWDKVGRFKQQYPRYSYELWTPDHLAKIQGPRGSLGW